MNKIAEQGKTRQQIQDPDYELKSISEEVMKDCARVCGITVAQMVSKSRKTEFVEARWLAYRILYPMGFSLISIGRIFNRDHGTVLNGLKKMQDMIDTKNKRVRFMREELENKYINV